MKIAVIGAGSAGLAALRHCTSGAYDCQVICYEKTDQIGGTWVYREEIGVDKYGLPIHTSMYKNLRTNLPKEVMGYPDYPVPDSPESYLTRTQMLNFLKSYCDHFNLRQHIRFLHNVELVEPTNNGDRKWSIKVKDLQRNTVTNESFDAVMVCNGHYFEPSLPKLRGKDIFQGRQMHSHDYRTPEVFADKTVLVIGAGPSGMDLAVDISKKATRVILSHHSRDPIGTVFPDNVIQKPDVKELIENGVIFADGSNESADVVFYCTGYKYNFPFLDEKCGIRVDSNMVTPLWKHLVSTENTSMVLIGLPYYVCAFNMFDLQVRFILKYWFGKKAFPPKANMLREENEELARKLKEGFQKRHFHLMGYEQGKYYDDLANTAEVMPLPPVITKLHNESSMRFLDDLTHYRDRRYKVIDNYNFIQL
ncbi:PREDICTED: senecionine N-oxygenase-like [Dufourea novaeangliae]|uniref:Flavin-containing monooxygenase n=1 Tax=Dufourea novaeangliae TaxID=178035 RepID=A0A154PME0_DUFNO|nr:PREDICTED: senecionine N-oxygenase-like [Dufourea novaeangliae]KZC12907.1 Flavin-containing monooxygenase FMO GS-OX-like 3 [Dufourea novaeangliae]